MEYTRNYHDRKNVGGTWRPIIEAEKHLHNPWFTENKIKYFKEDFIKFVEGSTYDINQEPNRRKLARVLIFLLFGRSPKLKSNSESELKKKIKMSNKRQKLKMRN